MAGKNGPTSDQQAGDTATTDIQMNEGAVFEGKGVSVFSSDFFGNGGDSFFDSEELEADFTLQLSSTVGSKNSTNNYQDVQQVQSKLWRLGLLSDGDYTKESLATESASGTESGENTNLEVPKEDIPATIAALQQFQRFTQLDDDGVVGPLGNTIKKINSIHSKEDLEAAKGDIGTKKVGKAEKSDPNKERRRSRYSAVAMKQAVKLLDKHALLSLKLKQIYWLDEEDLGKDLAKNHLSSTSVIYSIFALLGRMGDQEDKEQVAEYLLSNIPADLQKNLDSELQQYLNKLVAEEEQEYRAANGMSGLLTFDSEGLEARNTPWFSRRVHWPGGKSGITIGRGYDLGFHTEAEIEEDMEKAGVSSADRAAFKKVAGLKGETARQKFEDTKDQFPEISWEQQQKLFEVTYAEASGEVLRISSKEDVVDAYGQVDWQNLHPGIRDIFVDLLFRGDYTGMSGKNGGTRKLLQKYAVDNDVEGLYKVISNEKYWIGEERHTQSDVPRDRFERRKNYLEAAMKNKAQIVSSNNTNTKTSGEVGETTTSDKESNFSFTGLIFGSLYAGYKLWDQVTSENQEKESGNELVDGSVWTVIDDDARLRDEAGTALKDEDGELILVPLNKKVKIIEEKESPTGLKVKIIDAESDQLIGWTAYSNLSVSFMPLDSFLSQDPDLNTEYEADNSGWVNCRKVASEMVLKYLSQHKKSKLIELGLDDIEDYPNASIDQLAIGTGHFLRILEEDKSKRSETGVKNYYVNEDWLKPSAQMEEAISYIDDYLNKGIPVVVGVDHTYNRYLKNSEDSDYRKSSSKGLGYNEGTTDHFITLTGIGTDPRTGKKFYSFFDPGRNSVDKGAKNENNKLIEQSTGVYKASGFTSTAEKTYRLSMVVIFPSDVDRFDQKIIEENAKQFETVGKG